MAEEKRNYQKELDRILSGIAAQAGADEPTAGSVGDAAQTGHAGRSRVAAGWVSAAGADTPSGGTAHGESPGSQTGAGKPRLLLHSCCGPCSSYVLKYLEPYFNLTVYYYNPSIFPREEYLHRKAEQKRLIEAMNAAGCAISFAEGDYRHEDYLQLIKGLEAEPEGGERCHLCYRQRLLGAVKYAKAGGFDWYCTTLTVSPYKNAALLNELGRQLGEEYGVPFLPSDFKKKDGCKQSIALSKQYGLYRQDYCGCEFCSHGGNSHEEDKKPG